MKKKTTKTKTGRRGRPPVPEGSGQEKVMSFRVSEAVDETFEGIVEGTTDEFGDRVKKSELKREIFKLGLKAWMDQLPEDEVKALLERRKQKKRS